MTDPTNGAAPLRARHAARWRDRLEPYVARAGKPRPMVVEGKLKRMVGLTLEAVGCEAAVGDRCRIVRPGGQPVMTEVVGFSSDALLLMPIGDVRGLAPNARVVPSGRGGRAKVGDALLGRVVDGTGRALDGGPPIRFSATVALQGEPINPLTRRPISNPLDVGVRAINALLTVAEGQRIGLFAGSGAGKSVLLGMMTRFTTADVIVVGLIGERGREVNEFVENILGEAGRARSVVVAAPADDPPIVRMHGAAFATAIAEYFRAKGLRVLLLLDSLTRYAQAQREVGLAIGEPPAVRGFPPSVFARIPQLVERAGNGGESGGSITAFYTVLTEGDPGEDPVAESARAILDGHVVLSRSLGERGHYPAIDVESSISRVMNDVIDDDHLALARRFRELHATYENNADLISVGAYTRGTDPDIDQAIEMYPALNRFLRQDASEQLDFAASVAQLRALLAESNAVVASNRAEAAA